MRFARPLLLLLIALAGQACSGSHSFKGDCTTDKECPVGAYCKSGLCACRTDEACMPGEFCNGQGVCQTREGCTTNTDCDPAKFCDIASGACIDRTACGSDVHCLAGSICDLTMMKCVDGCHETADCPLYSVCKINAGAALGACIQGMCGSDQFCNFREKCVNQACVRDMDPSRPYCDACTNRPGECGGPANYCLVNGSYDPSNPNGGSQYFCAPDCAADPNLCPNGYTCYPVVLLTNNSCSNDAACGGGGRICVKGEGETIGGCTCLTDPECNPNGAFCLPTGLCSNSGRPCQSSNQCVLSCVQGGCVLGAACGPDQGLTCPIVR